MGFLNGGGRGLSDFLDIFAVGGGDFGDNGLSTIATRGLSGFEDVDFGVQGVLGISIIGLGVRCGTKSDWPVERNIPFRTGHGALLLLLDII